MQLIKRLDCGAFFMETITHQDGKPVSRIVFILEDETRVFLYPSELVTFPEFIKELQNGQEKRHF